MKLRIPTYQAVTFPVLATAVLLLNTDASQAGFGRAPKAAGARKALVTRVVQVTEELKLGGEMKFRVELKNLTKRAVAIDTQGLGHFGVTHHLLTKGGKAVRCINPSESGLSTSQELKIVKPGKTIVLETFDLGKNFAIVRPGHYKFNMSGWRGSNFAGRVRSAVPASQTIDVRIHPGTLTPAGQLVKRIEPIVPQDWHLVVWDSGSLVLGHFPKEGGLVRLTMTGWKADARPAPNSKFLCNSPWGRLHVNVYVGRAKGRRVPKGGLDDYWSDALEKLKQAIRKQ